MNFTHSIKFRFNLWYLAILFFLLLLLGCGVYFSFSRVLHGHLDTSLKNRFLQLSEFRDIIAIVGSGVFEEEAGEFVSFFYHNNGQLKHISNRNERIPLDSELINSIRIFFSFLNDIFLHVLFIFKRFKP